MKRCKVVDGRKGEFTDIDEMMFVCILKTTDVSIFRCYLLIFKHRLYYLCAKVCNRIQEFLQISSSPLGNLKLK